MEKKEIAKKVNYDIAGFDGPIGVAEDITSADLMPKSIQIVQPNHRALSDERFEGKTGCFINGNTLEVLANGYGDNAPGLTIYVISMRKSWRIYERINKDEMGPFIESVLWTPANAAMYKLRPDAICKLVYSYLVRIDGDKEDCPAYLTLKGLGISVTKDFTQIFKDLWTTEKRPSFSKAVTLKVRLEPGKKEGTKFFVPYIHAVTDAPASEYQKCLEIYKESKKFLESMMDREESIPAGKPLAEIQKVREVFDGAIEVTSDDYDF